MTTLRHIAPMSRTRRARAYKPYRPMFAPDPLNAVADSWRTPRPSKSPMVASLGLRVVA